MKKPNSIQFVLSAKKILSVNALYGAKLTYSGTRPIATMYKKAEAKQMESYIKDQVKAMEIPEWMKEDTKFKFTFTVIFKSGFFMRDLDNCCKNLIDGIFRALGYNDSHICEIHCNKTLCPDISEEKICIEMSEYVGETRFDKISEKTPTPETYYLSGEEDKKLISGLTKKNITRVQDKDQAECEIYLISEKTEPHIIAEVMSAAYEASVGGYGCLLCGILGNKTESLEKTRDLIKTIASGSKRIISEFIDSPEDLVNYVNKKRKRK